MTKPRGTSPLSFNDIAVARNKSTKHLGIILDEKLNFREHILESIEKAKKGLSLMKYLSSFVNRKTLVLTYSMHVRPILSMVTLSSMNVPNILWTCSKASSNKQAS